MASLYAFRALRPVPASAARVAAVPYDVVTPDEARRLSGGNPLSFLHVSRPDAGLAGVDPYADVVYATAAKTFEHLKREAPLVVESEPSVYFYRLRMGTHEQTGLGACYSLDEYDRDIIRKHERTRRDKEDDRTRHLIALGAQTGPVFLVYRASAAVNQMASRAMMQEPLFDFEAPDGVRHTIWRVTGEDVRKLAEAFAEIPLLYIADGHHRAASAARARHSLEGDRRPVLPRHLLPAARPSAVFLGVAFPHDQTQILPYNRVVTDLAGLSPESFLAEVKTRFRVAPGPATPSRKGEIAMYFNGGWQTLAPSDGGRRPSGRDIIATLDASVLQEELLAPILKITDVRTDRRVDFIGGARGTRELERLVNEGQAAVAFSLHPVSIDDLLKVADDGGIMPPKSTWFEPKLRDGLLIHMI